MKKESKSHYSLRNCSVISLKSFFININMNKKLILQITFAKCFFHCTYYNNIILSIIQDAISNIKPCCKKTIWKQIQKHNSRK